MAARSTPPRRPSRGGRGRCIGQDLARLPVWALGGVRTESSAPPRPGCGARRGPAPPGRGRNAGETGRGRWGAKAQRGPGTPPRVRPTDNQVGHRAQGAIRTVAKGSHVAAKAKGGSHHTGVFGILFDPILASCERFGCGLQVLPFFLWEWADVRRGDTNLDGLTPPHQGVAISTQVAILANYPSHHAKGGLLGRLPPLLSLPLSLFLGEVCSENRLERRCLPSLLEGLVVFLRNRVHRL